MINIKPKYILFVFIIIYGIVWIRKSVWLNLKCVISDKNGKRYCVRERENTQEAVELLATCVENMKKLVSHMDRKYPNDERVKRLVKNFNPDKIRETLPTSEHSAYSENKGERLAFCLNKNDSNKKLVDLNTLMFVASHELAHVMTISLGHTPEFWKNMKFILENAVEIKIYKPVDYEKNNEVYCGDGITNNPYYDHE
tara:strand:- start:237 stop:830 length:594 start_codon:yes stop_codon:yes gene_type:complete